MDISAPQFFSPSAQVYTTKMKFYFTERKGMDAHENSASAKQLRKILLTYSFASTGMVKTEEFYFNAKGEFIFYYSASDDKEANEHYESRYYFDEDKLIRAIEDVRPLKGKVVDRKRVQLDYNFL